MVDENGYGNVISPRGDLFRFSFLYVHNIIQVYTLHMYKS